MATKEEILDGIASMTVLELSELLKAFEEKFGVTAAAPVAVAAVAANGGGEAAPVEEEQDEFDVILLAAGEKKIQVIKEVRCSHQPGAERGEGPRGQRPEGRAREGVEGRRREGQGPARGGWRRSRAQVVPLWAAVRPGAEQGRCRVTVPKTS